MADKIVIELDLQSGDVSVPFKDIEKKAGDSGKDAGNNFKKAFNKANVKGGEFLTSLTRSTAKLTAAFTALGAVGIGFVLKEATEAAAVQEDAINRLNGALQSSGDFSKAASEDLQDYARQLQSTTKFGDEVILNQLALAKSFGATNQQAKDIAAAATDLSAALGIDLESATRNVAKTLGGYAGELGETIPQLKNLTTAQLQAGDGVALLAKQFSGQAANAVQTFSGRIAQTKNTFGDLLETIGDFITKNPFVLKAISEINKLFLSSITAVSKFFKELDTFNDVIEPILRFNDAVITNVIAPLEQLINIGKIPFIVISGGINEAIALFAKFGGVVGEILSGVGIENNLVGFLKDFAVTSEEVARESQEDFTKALDGIFDFPISEKFAAKNEELRTGLQTFNQTLLESGEQTKAISRGITEEVVAANAMTIEEIRRTAEAARAEQEAVLAASSKLLAGANRIINQGLVRTISGGIQNITAALAAGKNVFQEFGSFILTTFGDLAIQLGEFYIAEGIAKTALLNANPGAQIAAGAALIAVGSIIKSAFAGGGGAGASGGAAASGVGATATDAGTSGFDQSGLTDDPSAIQRSEPKTELSVNIQGDVLDSDESGTRIAKILSDSFGKQGIVLSDARFA